MNPFADLEFLKRFLELLTDYIAHYDPTPSSRLYITAICSLGTDASPNDLAPDEFGCAETVDTIYHKAFGIYIAGTLSLGTAKLYVKLTNDTLHWSRVDVPQKGDIVISPTGYGTGTLPNGHVGIVGKDGRIMSNNSYTGYFEENYTISSWQARYVGIGGYPMKYFRRI